MMKLRKTAGLAGLILMALILASCTAQATAPTVQPTANLDVVRTEVAQTVVAKITYDAMLNPSATPLPTNTTMPPTAPAPQATATTAASLPPAVPTATTKPATGGSGSVFVPSKTPYTDAALLVTQTPVDGTSFSPGSDFDILWTLKNVGLRSWNDNFYVRYSSGEKGSKTSLVYLPAISVNETADVRIDMIAPLQPGTYNTTWQVVNDDGTVFYTVNLVFKVK